MKLIGEHKEIAGQLVRYGVDRRPREHRQYRRLLGAGGERHGSRISPGRSASLAAVLVGYVVHSRWSFRGHGRRDNLARTGGRFFAVSLVSFALNQLWVWLLVSHFAPAALGALPARARGDAADRLLAQPPLGVRMSDAPVLTLIAPVKDEEEAIAPFLARVAPILDGLFADGAWEILFVDDGSEDETLAAILKAPSAPTRASGRCRCRAISARRRR